MRPARMLVECTCGRMVSMLVRVCATGRAASARMLVDVSAVCVLVLGMRTVLLLMLSELRHRQLMPGMLLSVWQ
jgi:hypothetical protein